MARTTRQLAHGLHVDPDRGAREQLWVKDRHDGTAVVHNHHSRVPAHEKVHIVLGDREDELPYVTTP